MAAIYDKIGLNYSELRKPDSRIAEAIRSELGGAKTVLNVGAGTGSYEPSDLTVTAIEPSAEMIKKRAPEIAVAIQASADDLPFDDKVFDVAMAVLTIHHWPDKEAGLREIRRVTKGRIVLVTFDPAHRPWLTHYLPELAILDESQMPEMADYQRWLGNIEIKPLLVPHDCSDGFLHAYWRRPEAYLDPRIRSGSSSFWAIGDVNAGIQRLAADLVSGEWERRYFDLLTLDVYDAGYRLVIAD
jgi:SAM-dependent methyltransferase